MKIADTDLMAGLHSLHLKLSANILNEEPFAQGNLFHLSPGVYSIYLHHVAGCINRWNLTTKKTKDIP